MTQSARVLRRLLSHGSVNPVDFQSPTCDGLSPILRVAARVLELKERGYEIETRIEKNRTTTYLLKLEVEQESRAVPTVDSPSAERAPGVLPSKARSAAPAESLFEVPAGNGYEVAA